MVWCFVEGTKSLLLLIGYHSVHRKHDGIGRKRKDALTDYSTLNIDPRKSLIVMDARPPRQRCNRQNILLAKSTNIQTTPSTYCVFFSFFASFPPDFAHNTAPTIPKNPAATAATVPIWIIPALLLSSTGTSMRVQVPFALAPTTGAGAGDK